MADFVAILSKTIDGLGERNSAEMRQKVYERARKAIGDKLAAISPPPSKAQADRQYKLLDDAIGELELRYAPAPKTVVNSDPLADFLASADEALAAPSMAQAPVSRSADAFRQSELPPFPGFGKSTAATAPIAPVPPAVIQTTSSANSKTDPVIGLDDADSLDALPKIAKPVAAKASSGGAKGAIFALLGLLLIGGAGYAGYVYKDKILGTPATDATKAEPTTGTAAQTAEVKPAETATPAQPVTPDVPAQESSPEAAPPKMTQRLTPEGQEVDAGPGSVPQDVGEGTTVASATTPSGQTPVTPETQPAGDQPVAVGQKAIFYEEKTGTEQGTADQGSIVWSVVQDSPGLDQPPEPAIRGDLTIADKGISVRLTIKRNVDKSLPASHIIEMLFTTPPDFAGGAIENVSRFSMKETEQAPGNPLVGVPANFGDGFFLIALTDEKTAIDANVQLLDRENWIDVPVAYRSGRRALLSFEKGLSGDRVFKEVLKAWAEKGGATPTPAATPPANGG